jgi:hypothetical protein
MMRELDLVALTSDRPDYCLERGDVGTVVHVYTAGQTYEVEFVAASGTTIAVLTLDDGAIRPLAGRELLHVRPLAASA